MRRLFLAFLLLFPFALLAQNAADSTYRMPPKEIADVVDVPPPPSANLSPDGNWLAPDAGAGHAHGRGPAQPELKLAGVALQSGNARPEPLALLDVADAGARFDR